MDFALSDDQRAIQGAARDFLTDAASPEVIRAVVEGTTGFDESLWQALAGEMGFAGLMVPETHGGLGLGAVEMALVLEEMGRMLAPVPFSKRRFWRSRQCWQPGMRRSIRPSSLVSALAPGPVSLEQPTARPYRVIG